MTKGELCDKIILDIFINLKEVSLWLECPALNAVRIVKLELIPAAIVAMIACIVMLAIATFVIVLTVAAASWTVTVAAASNAIAANAANRSYRKFSAFLGMRRIYF